MESENVYYRNPSLWPGDTWADSESVSEWQDLSAGSGSHDYTADRTSEINEEKTGLDKQGSKPMQVVVQYYS